MFFFLLIGVKQSLMNRLANNFMCSESFQSFSISLQSTAYHGIRSNTRRAKNYDPTKLSHATFCLPTFGFNRHSFGFFDLIASDWRRPLLGSTTDTITIRRNLDTCETGKKLKMKETITGHISLNGRMQNL